MENLVQRTNICELMWDLMVETRKTDDLKKKSTSPQLVRS